MLGIVVTEHFDLQQVDRGAQLQEWLQALLLVANSLRTSANNFNNFI